MFNFFRRGESSSSSSSTNARDEEKKNDDDVPTPVARDDAVEGGGGRRRPSVYEEAAEMLAGAHVIYIFAEVRAMARERGDPLSSRLFDLPLTSDVVLQHIQFNGDALKERAIDHESLRTRLEFLRRHLREGNDNNGGGGVAGATNHNNISLLGNWMGSNRQQKQRQQQQRQSPTTLLTHFVDERSDKEIVHAITVNYVRERITVVFRGSVSQKDFIQDAKCTQNKVPNPVAKLFDDLDQTTETVSLHTGFYEYLWKRDKVTGKTRLETILDDVKDLLRKHPGYGLFVTGHSLGGALSTLCGFYAAADDEMYSLLSQRRQQPVVVYSVASPYCGNWKFRNAFMHLERLGRLQHLRIANAEDMVTLLPIFAPKAAILSPIASAVSGGAGNLYKHVGIRLQLIATSPKGKEPRGDGDEGDDDRGAGKKKCEFRHTLSYPKDRSDDDEYAKEVRDSMAAGKSLAKSFYYLITNDFDKINEYHSCDQYDERLSHCADDLKAATLSGLYSDRKIVGDVLNDEYRPAHMPSGVERAARAMGFFASTQSRGKLSSSTTSTSTPTSST